MTTFDGFAAKMRHASRALPDAQKRGVAAGALHVTQTIRRQPGYTDRLSGVGKKGVKVSVRYDMLSRGLAATVYARGPFHLVERDTRAHAMVRPRNRNRRRGKGVIQVIPGVGPRNTKGFDQHPGTKGKHPFARGVNQAAPGVPRIVQAEITRELARRF